MISYQTYYRKIYSLLFQGKVHIIFFIGLLCRLCLTGQFPDCYDSINFALGLHDYDPALLQPHFPGYPVYILISHGFYALFHDDVLALVLPNALFGSFLVYPLFTLTRKLFSEWVATATIVLYLINPLCWIQAERPVSDMTGMFFLVLSSSHLCSFYHEKRKYLLFFGSLLLGITMGVRPSYFPFFVLWLWVMYIAARNTNHFKGNTGYGIIGLAVGLCMWLIPYMLFIGWSPFFQQGVSFLRGHFTDWGGTILTYGGKKRVISFMQSIWLYGLGGWWYGTSPLRLIPSFLMGIFILYPYCQKGATVHRCFFLYYGIPYLLWIFFGQNVTQSRHVMPLIPILLMIIAYGLHKVYQKSSKMLSFLCMGTLIASLSIISFKILISYYDMLSIRIYCGIEKRMFDYYAPQWDARMVRNIEEMYYDLKSSYNPPQKIILLRKSDVNTFGLTHSATLKKVFSTNPYTDGMGGNLALFTLYVP